MTPLRLVLDTNVWLDWLVFRDPSVGPLRKAAAGRRVEILIDEACEAELERALGYELKRSVDIPAALAECRRVAKRIGPERDAAAAPLPPCRDADDQKFLEAALAAGAGFLLTRDRALLELARRVEGFRILTPEAFAVIIAAGGTMARKLFPDDKVHPAVREKLASYRQDIVAEVEAAIAANEIVVVGMRQNPFPKKARQLLDAAGLAYAYLEYGSYFSQYRRRLALKLWTGWPTFPMVFVRGVLVGGAADLERLLASGELGKKA